MDTSMIRKIALALLTLALPMAAEAQLYPLFGPVNGVLKGDAATPQTTAAASSDIRALWSGTCNGTTYLDGSGACSTPAGVAPSGAANLVYATPNGSSGSAVLRALVGADVPAINLATVGSNGGVTGILLGTNGGTSNGFFSVTGPSGSLKTFTFPNASANVLTDNALVTVAQGGTGVGTLTGLIKGNGTSAFSAATSANVISLWSGTCSSTTFLRGDGACASAGGGAVGGSNTQLQYNNSGVFGGAANLTFNNANGVFTVSGSANVSSQVIVGSSTSGQSFGLTLDAGTTSADYALLVANQAGTANYLQIKGDGTTVMGNSTGNPALTVNTTQEILQTSGASANIFANCANGGTSGQRCWGWRIGGALDLSLSPADDTGAPQTSHSAFDIVRGTGFVISEIDLSNTTDKAAIFGGGQPLNGNYTWTATYVGNGGVGLSSIVAVSGYIACADIPGSAVGASSATTFSVGTLPTAARPARPQSVIFPPTFEDNGVIGGFTASGIVNTNGTITFLKNNSSSGWTATGQKGVTTDTTMCYFLN